ncbi:MAG: hypothetical protein ACFFD2_02460 [Promethearchaeota archaeon]
MELFLARRPVLKHASLPFHCIFSIGNYPCVIMLKALADLFVGFMIGLFGVREPMITNKSVRTNLPREPRKVTPPEIMEALP